VVLVKQFLAEGVSPSATDEWGRSPLHCILDVEKDDNADTILKVLVENKADLSCAGAANGQTPLSVAASVGDLDAVNIFLQAGAKVDCKDHHGKHPLHLAAGCKQTAAPDIVRALLEHNADVSAEDEDGDTPLAIAKESSNMAVVGLLMTRK
jgi:ankyrin